MTRFNARPRRNRGTWLEGLLADQAEATGQSQEELGELIELMADETHVLIALDHPGPARGFAVLIPSESGRIFARLHVLEGTPREGFMALFSQIALHARRLPPVPGADEVRVVFADASALADHVKTAIEKYGEPYALDFLPEEEERDEDAADAEVAETSEPSAEGEPVAEGEEASAGDPEEGDDAEAEADEHVCEVCEREFTSAQALGSHKRTHD